MEPVVRELSLPRTSALLWAVFLAFAVGLVLGGQIANGIHHEPVSAAKDDDEIPASSFVAAEARLRQTIIDLRRKETGGSKP